MRRPAASDLQKSNTETGETEKDASKNLSVKNYNQAPAFTCPPSIVMGENLVVSVQPVQNASYYNLNIYDSFGRVYYYWMESAQTCVVGEFSLFGESGTVL